MNEYPECLYSVHPDCGAAQEWKLVGMLDGVAKYNAKALWNARYNEDGDEVQTFVTPEHSNGSYSLLSLQFVKKALENAGAEKWFLDKEQAIELSRKIFSEARPTGRVWKVVHYDFDRSPVVVRDGLSRKEAMECYSTRGHRKMFEWYKVEH
jgi:hypothetical protein